MIRPRLLRARPEDMLGFDPGGNPAEVPSTEGLAVMVVAPVTDAMKVVHADLVTGPIDRETVGQAIGFALSRSVLERLGEGPYDAAGLIEAVGALGVDWNVVRQDGPLRPFSAQ